MRTHSSKTLCTVAVAAFLLSTSSASAQEAPAAPTATPTPASVPTPAPAPAAPAPKASVTLYGTLNGNFQITQAKGATNPADSVVARNAVSIDSSNVGVRAQADLGNGVGVTAQCETSASFDGIDAKGICSRNSRVGVTSAYGTLFFGNWDTPLKGATAGTKVDDPFLSTDVFGYQSIIGSPGYNYRSGGWSTASDTKIAGFDVRASNSVGYHSPRWSGVSVKLQYSASEFASPTGSSIPQLASVAVNFDHEGLSLLAASEIHWDAYGLGTIAGNATTHATRDVAGRVGAGYQLDSPLGATTLSVLADLLSFNQENAAVDDVKSYSRFAWQVSAKHRYGDHELRARFDAASEADAKLASGSTVAYSTRGTSAKQLTLGYAYHLSKAAQAYLSFTKLLNDEAATYTLTIGGSPNVAGTTRAGADPQALALGLRYSF
jgi:predicted porin